MPIKLRLYDVSPRNPSVSETKHSLSLPIGRNIYDAQRLEEIKRKLCQESSNVTRGPYATKITNQFQPIFTIKNMNQDRISEYASAGRQLPPSNLCQVSARLIHGTQPKEQGAFADSRSSAMSCKLSGRRC